MSPSPVATQVYPPRSREAFQKWMEQIESRRGRHFTSVRVAPSMTPLIAVVEPDGSLCAAMTPEVLDRLFTYLGTNITPTHLFGLPISFPVGMGRSHGGIGTEPSE